jgi:hypothetical protein
MFDNRGATTWLSDSVSADLDPPSPATDDDWDWSDDLRWTIDSEPTE